MKVKLPSGAGVSSTKLGDWYPVFNSEVRQFILAVSSKTRLGVVLNAAPFASFPQRLPGAVLELLISIGVPEPIARQETGEMVESRLLKTEDRSIVGTLNEYRFQLEAWASYTREDLSQTLNMSLHLSKTISLKLPEGYPRDAARYALEAPVKGPHLRLAE